MAIPTSGPLTPKAKAAIDGATYRDLLDLWRYAPIGAFRHGDQTTEYFQERMAALREQNPAAAVAASKEVGW